MNVTENRLAAVLSRNWWALLLRGLVAIAFGILVWLLPGISLATLVLLFGVYILVDGILGIWAAIVGGNEGENRWVLALWGLVGIGVGILTFAAPGVTALALLFYIAIWAMATGVLEIVAAVRLRKEIAGEWLLVVGGLVSILFGFILMARPAAGALAVLWLIGVYAVVFGVLLVILAFKVRAFGSRRASS
jgi:uncharacterized membrane protein HdeD (DUF308 family)